VVVVVVATVPVTVEPGVVVVACVGTVTGLTVVTDEVDDDVDVAELVLVVDCVFDVDELVLLLVVRNV